MVKYNEKERAALEAKGQMTIFDQIEKKDVPSVSIEVKETKEVEVEVEIDLEDIEIERFSFDSFSGQGEPYESKFVGFDESKSQSDEEFILVVSKDEFDTIDDFKKAFGVKMALAQKEGIDSSKIADLYEKRLEISRLKSSKENTSNADKEAKSLKEDELNGAVYDDEPENEAPKEKATLKTKKKSNRI